MRDTTFQSSIEREKKWHEERVRRRGHMNEEKEEI